jgi:hypothetical protein
MIKTALPFLSRSEPIFHGEARGFFMSPVSALEMRGLLRQADKKVSMVELGIEFGACDPHSRYGREVLRCAMRKDAINRFALMHTNIMSFSKTTVALAEVIDPRTQEMRTVVEYNLMKQRGQSIEIGAPARDYVLVGPLVTASVCEVARQYLDQAEKPHGFAVSVIENTLENYEQLTN